MLNIEMKSFNISAPIISLNINLLAAIFIYVIVFVIVAIIFWGIDWGMFLNQNQKTSFMGIAIYLIATLCATFLIGSLFIVFTVLIPSLI